MTANPFPQWLADVAADDVTVDPGDINAEAQANLWGFSIAAETAARTPAAEVEAFAARVADARARWLRAHQSPAMLLYWWHDWQAGQLRFSLVSASHGRLPFSREVTPAPALRPIVEEWLRSPCLDGIPFSALSPAADDVPSGDIAPKDLLVWSTQLP